MSEAKALLSQAMKATETAEADRLAAQAILHAPDYGAAYGLRAWLAARRGDPAVAAHLFRVAYARGDRSPGTRVGLAGCAEVAGDPAAAARIRAGAKVPDELALFLEQIQGQSGLLRRVLQAALPPPGTPAWSPGERPPVLVRRAPQTSAVPLSIPPMSLPPPAVPSVSVVRPRARVRRGAVANPSWLEAAPQMVAGVPPVNLNWLDTQIYSDAGDAEGRRLDLSGRSVDIGHDPGVSTVRARSPVTGRLIEPTRMDGVMPDLGTIADPLEARAALSACVQADEKIWFAVRLPGPVITQAGISHQKLCDRVVFGLVGARLILKDEAEEMASVEVTLGGVAQLEVLNDGRQLSLALRDGRKLHLDLRELRARAFRAAISVVDQLEAALQPTSAEGTPRP